MIILKPLAFVFFNMLAGFVLIFLIKAILFIPAREIFIFKRRIPFTPAFVYRKKRWLIRKLNLLLDQYIADTKDFTESSRLYRWESKIYKGIFEKIDFIDKQKWLPSAMKRKFKEFIATLGYEIAKQFLRSFVPYLIERYNLRKYIDLLKIKLDVDVIKGYFNRYIYKYLLIVTLSFCFLVGLGNMLIYLFVK